MRLADSHSRDRRLVTLWAAGATAETIRSRLGWPSVDKVYARVASLRRQGVALARRPHRERVQAIRRPRFGALPGPYRAAGREALLMRAAVPPAILMDAQGRVIGSMDPVTRERRMA